MKTINTISNPPPSTIVIVIRTYCGSETVPVRPCLDLPTHMTVLKECAWNTMGDVHMPCCQTWSHSFLLHINSVPFDCFWKNIHSIWLPTLITVCYEECQNPQHPHVVLVLPEPIAIDNGYEHNSYWDLRGPVDKAPHAARWGEMICFRALISTNTVL